MLFIFLFDIVKIVVPEPRISFSIPASIAEAAVVLPNGVKIFFAIGTATLINGRCILLNNEPKNHLD